MNRLRCFFTLLLLLACSLSFSQTAYLFVKKGYKKKKTYVEGDVIHLKLEDGSIRVGMITSLRNDSIFISGQPVPAQSVKEVILKKRPKKPLPDAKTMALITAGVALVTAGLTLSNQVDFDKALAAGLVIGYGPIVVTQLGSRAFGLFHRRKYKIGKKFRVQVFDLHPLPYRLKSF